MFTRKNVFQAIQTKDKKKALETLQKAWIEVRTEKAENPTDFQAKFFAASLYDAAQILEIADHEDPRFEYIYILACDGSPMTGQELAEGADKI